MPTPSSRWPVSNNRTKVLSKMVSIILSRGGVLGPEVMVRRTKRTMMSTTVRKTTMKKRTTSMTGTRRAKMTKATQSKYKIGSRQGCPKK